MDKLLHFKQFDLNYKYFKGTKNLGNFLLLHGRGGSSDSRVVVAEKLVEFGYNVYVPDLPGFGQTPMIKEYDIDEYATVVENFVKKLNLGPIILLGHSNGGRISIRLVMRKQIVIKKLLLNNSAGIKPRLSLKKRTFEKLAKVLKLFRFIPGYTIIRKILYKLIGGHDYLGVKDECMKKTFLNMIKIDQRYEISHIDIPTVLIRGEKDTYTPLADGKMMHSLIQGSQFVVLNGEKHGIHLQNPEKLVETILSDV